MPAAGPIATDASAPADDCADLDSLFEAAMARLGPFGPAPCLAVGVSGGADSSALVLLADGWARARGGGVLALVVDHGLRRAAAQEAVETARRLGNSGIAHELIRLGLPPGPALQARARAARHHALAAAARRSGIVHLLLGHHAADQDELRAMRRTRGPRGAEAMAGFSARNDVVLLRPLLDIRPDQLRRWLIARGISWIEDPSNADPRFERARIRAAGPLVDPEAAARAVRRRHQADQATARELARLVRLDPGGWAVIRAHSLSADALAALLRVIGGAVYPPARAAIDRLAACLASATLGGVRILPAGRLGPGWLLVREVSACAAPCIADAGAIWDHRFRLLAPVPAAARTFGALDPNSSGAGSTGDVARVLPSVIRRTLPALRDDASVLSIPHIARGVLARIVFSPPGPAAPAAFGPLQVGEQICARRSSPP